MAHRFLVFDYIIKKTQPQLRLMKNILTENTTKRCILHPRESAIKEFVCEHPMTLPATPLLYDSTSHPFSPYKKTTFSQRKRLPSPIPRKSDNHLILSFHAMKKYGGCHICVKEKFSYRFSREAVVRYLYRTGRSAGKYVLGACSRARG